MLKKVRLAALATLVIALPANADTVRNGFSVERLARLDNLLDGYVADAARMAARGEIEDAPSAFSLLLAAHFLETE